MWWSGKNRIQSFAKRADIKQQLAEAEPISREINGLLESRGVSVWTGMVALAVCLGQAAAIATVAGPFKGYLRVAKRFVESTFWIAYETAKQQRPEG